MSTTEGKKLSVKLGLKYFEVSALKNEGIDQAMIELVQMITRDYEKRQLSTITPGLEFPEIHEKERMSVGTDVGSNFTF